MTGAYRTLPAQALRQHHWVPMSYFLVIDDSPTIRDTLKAIIRSIDPSSKVAEAATEKEALETLQKARPDVVFLDMMLTDEGGGLEVGAAAVAKWPTTKVVILTGLSQDDPQVRKAVSMGAFAYLQKPIRREKVQKLFDSLDFEADRLRRIR
jgi:DNA-binding NarL/FixJ family response regulator